MRSSFISYGLLAFSILLLLTGVPPARAAQWNDDIIGSYSFDRCYDCDNAYFPGDFGTVKLNIINAHNDKIKIINLRVDFDFEIESIVAESGQRAELASRKNDSFILNFRVSDNPPKLDAKYSFFVTVEYEAWDKVNRFWIPNLGVSSPLDFILISTPLTGNASDAISNAENLLQLELVKPHLTIEALNLLEDAERELSLAKEEFSLRNWSQSIGHSQRVVELLAEVVVLERAHSQQLFDEASQIVDRISSLEMSDSTALENLGLAKESMKRAASALENGEFALAIIEARNGVVYAQEAEKLHLSLVGSNKDTANAAIARADRQLNFYKNLVLIPTDEASKIVLQVEQLIQEARTAFENEDYIKASDKASEAFELSKTLRSADRRSEAIAEITKARTTLEEYESTTVVLDPAIVELVAEAKEAIKSAESALAAGNHNEAIADAGKVSGILLQAKNLESVETINVAQDRNVQLLSGVGIAGVVALVLVSIFRRKGKRAGGEIDDQQLEVTEDISEEPVVDNYGEVNEYGEEPIEDISEQEIEYTNIDEEVTSKIDDKVPVAETIIPEPEVAVRPEPEAEVRPKRKAVQKRKVAPVKVTKRTTPKKSPKPRATSEKKPVARRRGRSSGRRRRRG